MGRQRLHCLILYLLLTGTHGNGVSTAPFLHTVWPCSCQVTDTIKNTHTPTDTPDGNGFWNADTADEQRFSTSMQTAGTLMPSQQSIPIVTGSNDNDANLQDSDDIILVTPDSRVNVDVTSAALSFGLSACSLSCEARCHNVLPLPHGGCFCDRDCELYGDCCLDYYIYCKEPISVNDTSLTLDEFDQLTKEQKEHLTLSLHLKNYYEWSMTQRETPPCEQITTRSTQDPIQSVPLTTQCPEDVSPELAQYTPYCEDPSLVENVLERHSLVFRDSIPTLAPALAFKNQYCAKCNGVFADNTLVKVNNPDFNCGNETKLAERLLREEGYHSFAQFLMQNCTPIYKPITEYHLKCLVLPIRYIDFCNKSMADVLHEYDQLEKTCKSYRTYVLSTETDPFDSVVYRNPHCALCNGHANLSTLACFDINYFEDWLQKDDVRAGTIGFPSFSLLMDFKGVHQSVAFNGFKICPAGFYLNFSKDKCVQNECRAGKVMLLGNCSRLQLNPALSSNMGKTFSILIQITNVTGAQDMAVPFFTHVFRLLDGNLPLSLNVSLDTGCSILQTLADVHGPQNGSHTSRQQDTVSDLCVIAEFVRQGVLDRSTLKTIETVAHISSLSRTITRETRNSLLDFVEQNGFGFHSIIFQKIHLLNYGSGDQLRTDCEEHRRITSQRQTVFLAEKNTGPDGSPPSLAVHWSEFDLTLSLEEFPALLSWARPNVRRSISHWPVSILSSNCLPDIFTCEQVMLQTSDVVVGDGGYIRVKDQVDVIGPEQHARSEDGVFICRNMLKNTTLARSSSASDIEGWLTLCGITLSLAGLFITLATYWTFPALRTQPGLAIMNLCFALFAAQVLFEVSPVVAVGQDPGPFCVFVGTLQHYSWLAAFFWMNVLAFDAALTFGAKTLDTQQKAKSSNFRGYLLYAWGVPALIVCFCVCFNLMSWGSFDYIDLDLCWLKSGRTLLVGFGAPLAVLVFLNVLFFLKTALSLKKTLSQTQTAASNLQSKSSYKIYVKLFSIMGLSWILGFISAATNLQWVSFGFIVVNSLQGVFICLSFGLTTRIRKMYRAKWTFLRQKINKGCATTHSSLKQPGLGPVSNALQEETEPARRITLKTVL